MRMVNISNEKSMQSYTARCSRYKNKYTNLVCGKTAVGRNYNLPRDSRMPMSVKKRYDELLSNNPEDEKSQIMIRNYYDALKHPSEKDLDSFEIDLKKRFSI